MSNVLLETNNGRLKLAATNFETSLVLWIEADIQEEGSITLPAKTLVDMVGNFFPGEVVLSVNHKTQTATLKNASSINDIKGIDAADFPTIPVPSLQSGIDVNLENFKSLVKQVAFSASMDDTRPTLNGIKLDISGRKLTLTSTDGYRLSVREEVLVDPVNKDFSVLIPVRSMNELARINPNGKTLTIDVPENGDRVIFHMENVNLVSQLISGNFPSVQNIIPSTHNTRTIVSTQEFLDACKQVQVVAREDGYTATLSIAGDPDSGSMEIKTQNDSTGNSDVSIFAGVEGDPLKISFDIRYLLEALEVMNSKDVAIETTSGKTAAVIKPAIDEGYIHVIMPRVV